VAHPERAQQAVLTRLLPDYARTDFGAKRRASEVGAVDEYRRGFPVMTYDDY